MKRIQFSANTHKRLNIAVSCLVAVVWGVLLYYALRPTNEPQKHIAATSSVQQSSGASTNIPQIKATSLPHHNTVVSSQGSYVQSKPMSSTSSMHIYETSNATVHNIGGGGGNAGGIATTSGSSSRGISQGGNMVTLSSSLALAEPGASEANEIANVASQPNAAPSNGGPRRVNGSPDIPFPDPIGDAVWPLIILALGYMGYRWMRRKMYDF